MNWKRIAAQVGIKLVKRWWERRKARKRGFQIEKVENCQCQICESHKKK